MVYLPVHDGQKNSYMLYQVIRLQKRQLENARKKNSDDMHKVCEKLQSKYIMLALEDDGIEIRSELGDETL